MTRPPVRDGARLGRDALPTKYALTSGAAARAQRRYLGFARFEIALGFATVVAGAVAGIERGWSWVGLIGTVALILLTLVRVHQRVTQVEHNWVDSRDAAEEVKSLARLERPVARARPQPRLSRGETTRAQHRVAVARS